MKSGDLLEASIHTSEALKKELYFYFLPTDPFILEKVNSQLEELLSFMRSCPWPVEPETVFWNYSIFSVRKVIGLLWLFFVVCLFCFLIDDRFFSRALY